MTLYEIDSRITACLMAMTDEDGEVTGEDIDFAEIEQLQMEREQKIENLALWVKDMTAEAEAIKREEKILAGRRRTLENKSKSVKALLNGFLSGETFKSPRVSVSYRKVPSTVEILCDASQLPDMYRRVSYEADKKAITDALKQGVKIEGCSLIEDKKSMSIR